MRECHGLLKEKLTTALVVTHPSFSQPYIVETDASINGLGAVLAQIQPDGRLQPVAYASRSLSAAKRNYSDIELETLAGVWRWQDLVGDSPHRP